MVNKPKKKGTTFESDMVKYFQSAGFGALRLALTGAKDCGDVRVTLDHDVRAYLVAECKNHKTITRSSIEQWRAQTAREIQNYRALYSDETVVCALIVHKHGTPHKDCEVHVPNEVFGCWVICYLDEFIARLQEKMWPT